MLKRYIGDRAFYRRAFAIAVPIIIQNGITNFVSLLDNIMIGQIGTLEMSGVSVVNQLMLVLSICIFGVTSGAGIFTAQFHGSNNHEGIRHTVRYKLIACLIFAVAAITLFLLWGDVLINLYLQGEGNPADAAATLQHGKTYLMIMLWGIVPFALTNVYASTLRECGKATLPMVGGVIAVFINLIFNYILIFGHFGAPRMGVAGAAIATVISRYVELLVIAGWTHLHPNRNLFVKGLFHSLYVPAKTLKQIFIKGLPLLVNEFSWSTGMAFLSQCYSVCGLDVVPASNIANTITNLSSVVFLAMGSTVGIIMGQMLGAKQPKAEIEDTSRKLIAMGVASGVLFGCVMAALSGVFPLLYNTSDAVRQLATQMILLTSVVWMPLHAYLNPVYFTIRAGGRTLITCLYDSGFLWFAMIPVAYVLSRFTDIPILWLYGICHGMEIIKCLIGGTMLKKGTWMQNLAE